jgi:hypothetical protein
LFAEVSFGLVCAVDGSEAVEGSWAESEGLGEAAAFA